MNILNLIQTSNLTLIGYTSINENLVHQHLDLLGQIEYLPVEEKSHLVDQRKFNRIEYLRDFYLNQLIK